MAAHGYDLGPTHQMDQRQREASEFYEAVLDPDERPWFVSDLATVYDISMASQAELMARCREQYGVDVRPEHLSLRVWELLDLLGRSRKR